MDTLEVNVNDLMAQRSNEGWPEEGKIGHLHLKTHNLESAYEFYVEKLGFEHISNFPQALFMSTQKYHHHIATNTWQSNKIRTQNEQTYGLCHFDIYQPNANTTHVTSPEGFDITIHGNETK